MVFSYEDAFSRNLGWTTEWEQAALRAKRVAIAGLGGVGGFHLLALTRLGIGSFSVAEFDSFDIVNTNRQAGANVHSFGRPKIDVMVEMATAINPQLRIRQFPEGVSNENVTAFLQGCDLYVDGLDFFALDIRARVFETARAMGIPAFTAAPIGMGVGFLAFHPKGQSFEHYFRLEGQSGLERSLRFLLGVAPAGLHRSYLADDTRVDLPRQRGPSTVAACELCAGMVATQALKQLLDRGGVPFAPVHLTVDAYRGRLTRTRLRWGNAGPLQRLKLAIARPIFAGIANASPAEWPKTPTSIMEEILQAARWSPSGDNSQPWRFQLLDETHVRVHLLRDSVDNPYDYRDGEPNLLSGGMLMQSLAIAASAFGRTLAWSLEDDNSWTLDVRFTEDAAVEPSPLLAALPMRSVERRGLGSAPLSPDDKATLQAALGPDLTVIWYEGLATRLKLARLGARATDIRLRARETFLVHQKVLDWENERSPTGLPVAAIGLSRAMVRLMRWSTRTFARTQRMNRIFGTSAISLQLDIIPAARSAALFSVHARPDAEPRTPVDLLHFGESLQRFWLAATNRGLAVQPALATLMFADHGARRTLFTSDRGLLQKSADLAVDFVKAYGPADRVHFLGRIGQKHPGLPGSRSVRKPLVELSVGHDVGNKTAFSSDQPVLAVGVRP